MAHKVTMIYLKTIIYNHTKTLKFKRLQAYLRALVYVPNTVDVISTNLFGQLSILSFFNLHLKQGVCQVREVRKKSGINLSLEKSGTLDKKSAKKKRFSRKKI